MINSTYLRWRAAEKACLAWPHKAWIVLASVRRPAVAIGRKATALPAPSAAWRGCCLAALR